MSDTTTSPKHKLEDEEAEKGSTHGSDGEEKPKTKPKKAKISKEKGKTATATTTVGEASAKAEKGGEKKAGGRAGNWTDEMDERLGDIVRKQGQRPSWSAILKTFLEEFPDSGKTINSVRSRYSQNIKGGDVQLDDDEKAAFKKCHDEIKKMTPTMLHEVIAWRYHTVTKKDMNKTAVAKLIKAMKGWDLESSTSGARGSNAGGSEDGDQEDEKDDGNTGDED